MIIGPGITITGGIYVDANAPATPADYGGSGSFNVTATNQIFRLPINSAFTYGTDDFTVEWWSRQNSASGVQGIWRNSTGDATNSIGFWTITQPSGRLTITLGNGVSSNTILSNAVIPTNSWRHYAVVRNGTLFKLYVDGVAQTQTITSSINIPAQVGIMQIGNAGGLYSGFITNFRIVKGTAVYLNDFTPPTTPLTVIANTSLLLSFANSSSFATDSGPNNITVTNNGAVTYNVATPFSSGVVTTGLQFNLATAPSTGSTWTDSSGNGRNATLLGSPSYVSNNGGGIRLNNEDLNGTNYISVPYNIASNTVTVEVVASFNPTSFWGTIWGNEIYDTSGGYVAYIDGSTNIFYGIPYGETAVTITASNAIRQWIFVINGTQVSIFLNGSQVGTTDTIGNQTTFATSEFYFGARHGNDGTGSADAMNNSDSALYPVFYQMRVYNKALSGAEITQNYNAVKGTYGI